MSGLGLGLSTCKSIVESMGGTLGFGSRARARAAPSGCTCPQPGRSAPNPTATGRSSPWTPGQAAHRRRRGTVPALHRRPPAPGRLPGGLRPGRARSRQACSGRGRPAAFPTSACPATPTCALVQGLPEPNRGLPVILMTGYPSAPDRDPGGQPVRAGLPGRAWSSGNCVGQVPAGVAQRRIQRRSPVGPADPGLGRGDGVLARFGPGAARRSSRCWGRCSAGWARP